MKKIKKLWIISVIVITLLFSVSLSITAKVADAEETVILTNDGAVSISIIGGADGPTSIFLAGRIGTGFKVAVVVGVVLLVVAAVVIVKSIMKKNHKEK